MPTNSCHSFIQRIASVAAIVLLASSVFAQTNDPNAVANRGYATYKDIPEQKKGTVIIDQKTQQGTSSAAPSALSPVQEESLNSMQRDARAYRNQGVALQNAGNIEGAMSLYQKAIELDPTYAVPYNDLGIIYEAKGFTDRAEESYTKSLKVDPNYLSAYTNLALVYENKRDLNKAAQYWQKRAELGAIDDPWTIKARHRLEDIHLVLAKSPYQDTREQEVMGFFKEVAAKRELLKRNDKALAKDNFDKAKRYYNKGDLVTARKIALDAQQLDPANEEITDFIDRIQRRLLSK